MTTQVIVLSAPKLLETVEVDKEVILFVHNLIDPAHGEVPLYPSDVGDKITFKVSTSTGNEEGYVYVVTSSDIGRPIIFDIPKIVFEKNLVAPATAELYYEVTKGSGITLASPVLQVHLRA